jgi:cyclohexa-1,5-dienecarbonyl-CoA hydratase
MSGPVTVAFNREQTRAAFRLSHPKGNIITLEMVTALRSAIEPLAENPHLKLVTIEGAGADFSFGASIPEHAPDRIAGVLPEMHRLLEDLLELPAVTAAVVRGRCLGGGFELALACDFIFAADSAVFGLPEIALGVFPPAGAALLPWRAGGGAATHAVICGDTRPASEWRDRGLIELVAPAAALAVEVDAWFQRHIEPKSAAALRHAAAAARLPLVHHVRTCLPALERLYLNDLMQSTDAVEGIAAFLDKRPPRWQDR